LALPGALRENAHALKVRDALAVDRIHVLGASGSGTSTLAAALSERYCYVHVDTDQYFWEPSDPPFQRAREVSARQRLLGEALDAHPRWVLAGSLCGWGDIFISRFELVVFLLLPPDIRMARLRERERRRYGADALAPGGRMHEASEAFIRWAEQYEIADESIRSLRLHEQWLAGLACKCLRLEGALSINEQIARLREFVS